MAETLRQIAARLLAEMLRASLSKRKTEP